MRASPANERIRYEADQRCPPLVSIGVGLQGAIFVLAPLALVVAITPQAGGQGESYLSWAVFAALIHRRPPHRSAGDPAVAGWGRSRAHHGARCRPCGIRSRSQAPGHDGPAAYRSISDEGAACGRPWLCADVRASRPRPLRALCEDNAPRIPDRARLRASLSSRI